MSGAGAQPPRLEVIPEPEPEELAAISVAVLALAATGDPSSLAQADPPQPAWRVAALREGVRGLAAGAPTGWGRPRAGWRG